MDDNLDLETLLAQRAKLLAEVAQTGDMRQGSITENYRRCGKPGCRCTAQDHPGHGPYYAFTRKVEGKTKTVNLRPSSRLRKLQREVETYRHFRGCCQELIKVNELICDARPVEGAGDAETALLKKKASPRPSRKKLPGR